jgi:transcriptional regulator with XRE-family HTH domain
MYRKYLSNKHRNNALTNARLEIPLTQEEFAKELGITIETYNKYENFIQLPGAHMRKKIENYFQNKGVKISSRGLFWGKENYFNKKENGLKKKRNLKLTKARLDLGMTLQKISEEIGVCIVSYNNYELQKNLPHAKTQERINNYFDERGIDIGEGGLFEKLK